MKQLALFIVFAGLLTTAAAQVTTPAPSPSSTIQQTVGLTEFTVDYSRPSVKGRTIFGGLVPYNKLWRTGANESTDITFSDAITFGGKEVAAGTYALYTFPGKDKWRVLLYEDTDIWGSPGDDFDPSKVVVQTEVKPAVLKHVVESFTIGFDHLRNNGAHLTICWDKTKVGVPIEVPTVKAVKKSIEQTFAESANEADANDYNKAAAFFLEEDMELEQAHAWAKKAVEMNPEAFWMMKTKAEIEAALGNYEQAIETARQSLEAAEKAGNSQYVDFNNDNISKWKKMR